MKHHTALGVLYSYAGPEGLEKYREVTDPDVRSRLHAELLALRQVLEDTKNEPDDVTIHVGQKLTAALTVGAEVRDNELTPLILEIRQLRSSRLPRKTYIRAREQQHPV